MGYRDVRIYVVVDGPRVVDPEHEEPQALLLDLERGTRRLVTAYLMTHGPNGAWLAFEP